jgi:putative SOS response-associated peptidase YedK
MVFAGICPNWTSTRKVKEGEGNADLFAFLTTEANGVVGLIQRPCP